MESAGNPNSLLRAPQRVGNSSSSTRKSTPKAEALERRFDSHFLIHETEGFQKYGYQR
jgi:hypothetical protein